MDLRFPNYIKVVEEKEGKTYLDVDLLRFAYSLVETQERLVNRINQLEREKFDLEHPISSEPEEN